MIGKKAAEPFAIVTGTLFALSFALALTGVVTTRRVVRRIVT